MVVLATKTTSAALNYCSPRTSFGPRGRCNSMSLSIQAKILTVSEIEGELNYRVQEIFCDLSLIWVSTKRVKGAASQVTVLAKYAFKFLPQYPAVVECVAYPKWGLISAILHPLGLSNSLRLKAQFLLLMWPTRGAENALANHGIYHTRPSWWHVIWRLPPV